MSSTLRTLLLLTTLLLPQIASAHSPVKGIGDFLNGMLHPLLVPAQVLILLALGLSYGQHQPSKQKTLVLLFLLATISGLAVSGFNPLINSDNLALLLLISTAILGLLIISNLSLPQPVFIVLGLVAGFLTGLDSAQETLTGKAKLAALFGSGVGIYFLLLYAMALSESLSKKHWQTIAVRVLASWVSASALMVLALHFSGRTGL